MSADDTTLAAEAPAPDQTPPTTDDLSELEIAAVLRAGDFPMTPTGEYKCPTCGIVNEECRYVRRHHSTAHQSPIAAGIYGASRLRESIITLHAEHGWSPIAIAEIATGVSASTIRNDLKGEGVYVIPDAHRQGPLNRTVRYYRNSPSALREDHALDHRFLPHSRLSYAPLEVMADVREYLEGRPATASMVGHTTLARDVGVLHTKAPIDLFALLHGWWPAPHREKQYVNPEYVHGPAAITDDDHRVEVFELACETGCIRGHELGPVFGIETRAVWDFHDRVEYDWNSNHEQGRRIIGRTWSLLNVLGHSQRELGYAFGVSRDQVRRRINEVADDFDPEPYLQKQLYQEGVLDGVMVE